MGIKCFLKLYFYFSYNAISPDLKCSLKKVKILMINRLRHTLHQRTLYSQEHFASQELNTLGSQTHLAKSQFTPQHTLLLNTLCHSEPFTPHYTLLLNTLCHSEPSTPHYTLLLNTLCLPTPFASWSTFLLNTFCSKDRNGNDPIYPLLSTWKSTWTEPVHQELFFTTSNEVIWTKIFQEAKCSRVQSGLRSKVS